MKEYIQPKISIIEIAAETMLAMSDRIPVGDEVKPSAAPKQRREWGNLWE